jgi:hypothetical protein
MWRDGGKTLMSANNLTKFKIINTILKNWSYNVEIG